MVSKAHATQSSPATGTATPGQTHTAQSHSTQAPSHAGLKTFCITHIRRSHPGKVQIDRVRAADNSDAQRRAAQQFPDSTILRVCRARAGESLEAAPAKSPRTLPNARFIRGEFRPADTEDEPALRDLCDDPA